MASDEVIDTIAHIEMHRQKMANETGPAAACGEALRRLHELLDRERAGLQLHGTATAHPANIEAVTAEVKRIKQLAGATNPGSISGKGRPAQRPVSRSDAPGNSVRNKGRRTMGRRGER
jgi:bacterioferritin-associated ferredoxin